jgi:predicted ester cyclase
MLVDSAESPRTREKGAFAMSTEGNKAVLRRWFEALNKGGISALEKLADELFTADFVLHDPAFPGLPPGPEGVKQFVRGVLQSMPDIHMTFEDMVAEGDRVASRAIVSGTDATTGKLVRLLVMAIDRFVGGKIAEEWELGVPEEGKSG